MEYKHIQGHRKIYMTKLSYSLHIFINLYFSGHDSLSDNLLCKINRNEFTMAR